MKKYCCFSIWGMMISSLSLSSCAVTPLSIPHPDDTRWILEAKIAYRDNLNNKNALLRWEQAEDNYEIHIFSPIAGELAWLKKTDDRFDMRVRGESYLALDNIEDALYEVTEMHIPIHHFQHWIRAKPAPNSIFREKLDDKGRRVYLEQHEWHIRYESHRGNLPIRMIAEKPPYRILIVPTVWQRLNDEKKPVAL